MESCYLFQDSEPTWQHVADGVCVCLSVFHNLTAAMLIYEFVTCDCYVCVELEILEKKRDLTKLTLGKYVTIFE